jgi:tetratricopeptide (TPR) repeat protein
MKARVLVCLALLLASCGLSAMTSLEAGVDAALNQARTFEQAGNANGALESYQRALERSRPTSAEQGQALAGLAGIEIGLGRYDAATRHASDAARVFELVGDTARAASSLNRGGRAALYAGDFREAERLFTSALAGSTKIGHLEGRAEELGNLANVHFFVGRYADAARLNDEALVVTTAAASEAWAARRRRILLANQAALYLRIGHHQQALAAYTELGSATRDLLPRERAQMLLNLGVLYRRLGDPIKALHTYDEARTLFASDRDVDGELGALTNRGIVLALDLEQPREAERSFAAALESATAVGDRREMLHARLYRGETRWRTGRPDESREDFVAGLTLARDLRTPEEIWKALYGLGRVETSRERSVAFFDEAVRTIEHLREDIRVPSLRSEFLNDKREVYDALIAANIATASPSSLFSLLERTHSRVWRERLDLTQPLDLGSVQRALPERALLLDYWSGQQGAAVIAVSRTRAAVFRVQSDPLQIKTLIDTLAAGPSEDWRALGAAAGARLLPPSEWFEGIERVLIVPDGAVALVPFEVLTVGERLLIERAAVSYTPTAATLVRNKPRGPRWLPPWQLQLRAFADPVFESAGLDDVTQLRGRLSGSAEEVRQIASELGGRAILHLGADDRKAYLLGTTERAPILHLATHAMADASAMEQSRMVFSSAVDSTPSADYLFLKEAYGLPLADVELAVLSACDTERGRYISGEGVQSFSRAFLASGARSTLTTMWRVADRPTADFMQLLYHHLQRGVPRDEALRQAKLRFLHTPSALADPHFWAAFVLTGDGLHPVPRAVTWNAVAIVTAGLAVIPVMGTRLYRRRVRRAAAPD